MREDLTIYLEETTILDFNNPKLVGFIKKHVHSNMTAKEKAIALFYAVRDTFLYNPYYINLSKEESKASKVIDRGYGHCIDKASILIATYRAVGLPSRIGLAKVKNHIATEKLEEYLGSNVLSPHGYVEVYLNEKWYKVTPAFNKSLCDKLHVACLEFDGHTDCLFQEYNQEGAKFMEYVEDYGSFADIPLAFIIQNMKDNYPKLRENLENKISIQL
ncbi:MAG: transglutaminase family protein [Chitinophagales bacterium]|nr:transglutaminase family protein [Chitinophagales bacterium]